MTGDTLAIVLPSDPLPFNKRQTATDRLPSLFDRRQLLGLRERVPEESHDDQSAEKASHGENLGRLIGWSDGRCSYLKRGSVTRGSAQPLPYHRTLLFRLASDGMKYLPIFSAKPIKILGRVS